MPPTTRKDRERPHPGLVLAAALALALFVGCGARLARAAAGLRVTATGRCGTSWISTDPDTLYHVRRTARALAEGRIAARDPLLAAGEPGRAAEGAAIPWPPHATVANVLWCRWNGVGPGDPAVETAVARLPALVASLAAALLVLAGAYLARGVPRWGSLAGGLFAGTGLALNLASLRYSAEGNGDHHALASLLVCACLVCGAAALAEHGERWRLRACLCPCLCAGAAGLAAGLVLGTWTGGLPFVALTGLVLALRAGPLEGLSFFAVALASVAPAVAGSPWLYEAPWSLVMLSWSQPTWLAAGIVGSLLGLAVRGPSRLRRWLQVSPVLLAGVALLLGGGAALEWGLGEGGFMSAVRESRAPRPGQLLRHLGPGSLLALPGMAVLVARRRAEAWLLVPAGLGLALLCPVQLRFAELGAAPLLLLGGLALAPLLGRLPRNGRGGLVALGLAVLLGVGGQLPGGAGEVFSRVRQSRDLGASLDARVRTVRTEHQRAVREGVEELAARGPGDGSRPVLAAWDLGHLIEWAAARPTVATNFGSYVAPEGYLLPWRFFAARGAEAEALLAARDVEYVVATSTFLRHGPGLERNLGAEAWRAALASPLLVQAGLVPSRIAPAPTSEAPPDFLRPVFLGRSLALPAEGGGRGASRPAVAVWQRVAGARLELVGEPGERARVVVRTEFPLAGREVLWWSEATVGADGLARVRVPCATDPGGPGPGGAEPRGELSWTVGSRRGELELSETMVLRGDVVRVDR